MDPTAVPPRAAGGAPLQARLEEMARSRVLGPIVEQLTQGLSADTIALTVAVGLCIAVIPIIGVTTALSFLAAWALRLNQPIIQTIWMNEERFSAYRRQPDFIQRYIFPGSELASLAEIRRSLARATRLEVAGVDEIGPHYVTTLAAWRRAFLANADRVRALGFPETFLRMWDYYLAYCEGGFAEGYIGDAQVLLAKSAVRGASGRASSGETASGARRIGRD